MTPEKMQEELEKANFMLLKVQLRNFINLKFNVCDGFINELNNCTNEETLIKLFKKYKDEVFERLGGDHEFDDEISKLEQTIEDLECELSNAQSELDEAKAAYGTTLNDEFKREYIEQYYNDYTPWELETLLKNGKKYLQNENVMY